MKQRLFVCLALAAALLASCKNDDIVISREVSFEINPYTAVSDFARHEVNYGDLTAFKYSDHPEYYKLRTYLLVYNTEGVLFKSEVVDLKNFSEKTKAVFELADGTYTIIALAIIFNEKENCSYWNVQNTERLNTLKVVNNIDYYDTWVKTMGIKSMKIDVGPGTKSYDVDLQPGVALMINYFLNIHYYSNMMSYQPFANKRTAMITFDVFGDYYTTYEENADPDYPLMDPFRIGEWSDRFFWYHCFAPLQMTQFGWSGTSVDGGVYALGGVRSANILAGKAFRSTIDLSTGSFFVEELGTGKEPSASSGDWLNSSLEKSTGFKINH